MQQKLPLWGSWLGVAETDEGGTQNRCRENPGEYVEIKAPLKGELAAQLTEGSGLAESQALHRRRKYRVFRTFEPEFRLRRRLF